MEERITKTKETKPIPEVPENLKRVVEVCLEGYTNLIKRDIRDGENRGELLSSMSRLEAKKLIQNLDLLKPLWQKFVTQPESFQPRSGYFRDLLFETEFAVIIDSREERLLPTDPQNPARQLRFWVKEMKEGLSLPTEEEILRQISSKGLSPEVTLAKKYKVLSHTTMEISLNSAYWDKKQETVVSSFGGGICFSFFPDNHWEVHGMRFVGRTAHITKDKVVPTEEIPLDFSRDVEKFIVTLEKMRKEA